MYMIMTSNDTYSFRNSNLFKSIRVEGTVPVCFCAVLCAILVAADLSMDVVPCGLVVLLVRGSINSTRRSLRTASL